MTSINLTKRPFEQPDVNAPHATARSKSNRIISSLRAVLMALALFGGAFSVGYADHMGNHLRPLTESTGDETTGPGVACGAENSDASTDVSLGDSASLPFRSSRPR